MTAQSFTRSPVRVGRQHGNQLRLDAHIVSRHHGAFLFSKDGLQFIDYGSANGSYVDGVRVAAHTEPPAFREQVRRRLPHSQQAAEHGAERPDEEQPLAGRAELLPEAIR